MRSVTVPADDRTAKARIRDAAIECFAEHGIAATTARKVAEAAGVSPGLVMHHFGSMDGLRSACDDHIAEIIRSQKSRALSAGPNMDILAALREADPGPMGAYLARILVDDSPAVARLVDDMVADAEVYLEQGVASGMLKPSADPRGRAVLLALWQLGALVLHKHMDRLIGVDLTDPDVTTKPALAAYAGPVYEVLGGGFFTADFLSQAQAAIAALAADGIADDSPSPDHPAQDRSSSKGTP
ncbi:MAG: TetR/AcrR family transcriptional regulator [Actinobacteria bacterium]|nr:TetR/AcrR family transcriptional regulator [Actinomycetota bacterium]